MSSISLMVLRKRFHLCSFFPFFEVFKPYGVHLKLIVDDNFSFVFLILIFYDNDTLMSLKDKRDDQCN